MSQNSSQMALSSPVQMNATRQPRLMAIHGTTIGVMIAPTLVPALKIPVASARSRDGNHSAIVLMAAGKLPDSPRPSEKRARLNWSVVRASDVAIADRLHTEIDNAYPSRVPILSSNRPANRKPSAYAAVNHETSAP